SAPAGTFTAALVVTASSGRRSRPRAEPLVIGNSPPVVTIVTPEAGTELGRGQPLALTGEALDPEDGVVSCDELTWTVRLVHGGRADPLATLVGCNVVLDPTTDHEDDVLLAYEVEL